MPKNEEDNRTFVWTPIGEYKFPYLFTADSYLGKEEYKVDILLSMEDPKVQDLMAKFDETAAEGERLAREAIETNGKLSPDDKADKLRKVDVKKGYTKEFTKGEYTGNIIIKAKSKFAPAVYDTNGSKYPGEIAIWGGSTGRIEISYAPFQAASGLCGTTIKLYKAQLQTRKGPGQGGPDNIDSIAGDLPAEQPSDERFDGDGACEEVKPQGGF